MVKVRLQRYEVLTSTNETAVLAAGKGAAEGTVIVADRQEGGHGRMQRKWSSPKGGLWFSIILRPLTEPEYVAQVTLLAGVAVTRAVRALYGTTKPSIKWPNDILWNGAKICGILSEMRLKEDGSTDYAIVGIGVNVDQSPETLPEELRETAAILNQVGEMKHTCDEVLEAVLEEFFTLYDSWQQKGFDSILSEWKRLNCTLGNLVDVRDDDQVIFQGIAENIDADGALRVVSREGVAKRYDFGEISIR